MPETPRLVDLVEAVHDNLTTAGIRHGFGSAIALAYYVGDPRATRDLNVNISVPVEEAQSVFAALPPKVARGRKAVEECRVRGQVRLWAGRPGSGIPVDLFFPQHRFHDVVADAVSDRPFLRPGYFLPVIAASHLVVFKVLFDRPKDWVDIASMLDAGTVDVADAQRWVRELLGTDHPSFLRLVDLVSSPRAETVKAGEDMDLPRVNWSALGSG